jgi:hypothetical protein
LCSILNVHGKDYPKYSDWCIHKSIVAYTIALFISIVLWIVASIMWHSRRPFGNVCLQFASSLAVPCVRPFTVKTRVHARASPYGICGTTRSFTGRGFRRVTLFSPVRIIPLEFHTHAYHLGMNNRRCEISSSHGGEYDVQSCLLGYTAV